MTKHGTILLLVVAVVAGGCFRRPAQPIEDLPSAYFEMPAMDEPPPVEPSSFPEASLWNESAGSSFLFLDHKARRVNDILIVHIVEQSSASNRAATKGAKTSRIKAGAKTVLGIENQVQHYVPGVNPEALIEAEFNNAFDGTGETTRQGTLVATVAARVKEVLPNGNLRIVGRREIIVNNEKQTIALTGVVRPKDISFNNEISSTAVADFQVQYGGRGMVSQHQYQGWFARFFNWIWPF